MVAQGLVDDLKSALSSSVCVNLTFGDGQRLWSGGVKEVREDDGVVVFFEPQHFGDDTTTRTIALSDVTEVEVTTLPYKGHSKD